MEEITKKDTTEEVRDRIANRKILHYQKKENRNKAYILLKNVGIMPEKSTSSNCQIHPEYIEDYAGTIEVGFGNSMYLTYFKKLYDLKREKE